MRTALKQSWLYDDEEIKMMKDQLKEIKKEKESEVHYRRTHLGFMKD